MEFGCVVECVKNKVQNLKKCHPFIVYHILAFSEFLV